MANFIKAGDRVIDLDRIIWFQLTNGVLSIALSGADESIEFRSPQAEAVYAQLIDVLKPENWNVPPLPPAAPKVSTPIVFSRHSISTNE